VLVDNILEDVLKCLSAEYYRNLHSLSKVVNHTDFSSQEWQGLLQRVICASPHAFKGLFGGNDPNGYSLDYGTLHNPFERIHFVGSFLINAMLDDASPCLMYHFQDTQKQWHSTYPSQAIRGEAPYVDQSTYRHYSESHHSSPGCLDKEGEHYDTHSLLEPSTWQVLLDYWESESQKRHERHVRAANLVGRTPEPILGQTETQMLQIFREIKENQCHIKAKRLS